MVRLFDDVNLITGAQITLGNDSQVGARPQCFGKAARKNTRSSELQVASKVPAVRTPQKLRFRLPSALQRAHRSRQFLRWLGFHQIRRAVSIDRSTAATTVSLPRHVEAPELFLNVDKF
jgi:hypothetical protein